MTEAYDRPAEDHETVGMTGMSRVFSTCEITLILFVYLALGKLEIPIIPLSYEADGVLLVGAVEVSQLEDILNRVNQKFNFYAKTFLKEKFYLEFKNLIVPQT